MNRTAFRHTCPCLLLCGLLLLIPGTISARDADASGPPLLTPPDLQASRAPGAVTVDGRLGDPGWSGARSVTRFLETSPGQNLQPGVETRAWLTFDDQNLYVAFECIDDPSRLRATMCQRDLYDRDDAVGLLLDTFGDATWAYEFFVNPYGIQKDIIWTSVQGEDPGFDMVWESAGRITPDGFIVEMAIPFSGMRFPDQAEQTWRLDFNRVHPRESDRRYTWSPRDPEDQCWPCQWGTVTGITGVEPGKGYEILPSFIAYRSSSIRSVDDPDSGLENQDLKGEPSLGFKFSPTSEVTVEGAVNPDFSQIEADADQIDVNSTILQRYPEKRPFFQEGNDLFRTMFNSFYTRMVNDPELAAKGTVRIDGTSIAALSARDEHSPYVVPAEERSYSASPGRSTVNVLRGLHSLGNNNQLGFMVTDRRYDHGGSGTILSADANVRLGRSYSWATQYVYSFTEEPEGFNIDGSTEGEDDVTFDRGRHTLDLDGESYSGAALITELRRRARNWSFTLDYNTVSPTYRTQTGYDPWNDQHNGFMWTNYAFYPETGILERVNPSVFTSGRWNYDGTRKWLNYQSNLDFRFRWAQTHCGISHSAGSEMWSGVEFEDLWSVGVDAGLRPSSMLSLAGFVSKGTGVAHGALVKGDETRVALQGEIKPLDRLIIEPTFDYLRSEDSATGNLLFRQTIVRARMRLQIDPRLSVRLVLQHNDTRHPEYEQYARDGLFPSYHMYFGSKWEVDPLLTYRLNSFSVFYLGSTHDYHDFNAANPDLPAQHELTDRTYFMKIQYLFQM